MLSILLNTVLYSLYYQLKTEREHFIDDMSIFFIIE